MFYSLLFMNMCYVFIFFCGNKKQAWEDFHVRKTEPKEFNGAYKPINKENLLC
jgi:hypothetical protein